MAPPATRAGARALTVVQLMPALASGGAERSTLEIGRALVASGHRSIVVSAGGRLVASLAAQGSEHVTLDIGRKSLRTLLHVFTLRRLLRQWRPDIVHARSRLPGWVGWLALRGLVPPPHFVTTVHGLNSPGRYSAILTRGERVICVSDTVRRHVLAHYPAVEPQRLVVIPRGIAPEEFPYGHRAAPEWRGHFAADFPTLRGRSLLVLPGRGTRLKGHADALRVLARLRQVERIEAALLLLGAREPGRERYIAEIEDEARTLGVADALAITPPRADVRDIYVNAACVLQFSNKPEAFGRTVVEALALGVPVVGYAHGGVGELLQELYPEGATPPGDIEQAATRIAAILRAPPAMQPMTRYRLADMQARTLALYEQVARAGRLEPAP